MASLKEITNGQLRFALGNSNLTKGILAINAGGAATVKTTNALNFAIDGVYLTKAALAVQSIVPTHDAFGAPIGGQNLPVYVQPANTTVYYLLSLDATGAVKVSQGSYAGQSMLYPDKQRILTGSGNVPAEPAGTVAIGLIKVATGAATAFTPGTTALDAAGVTVTYFDLEYVPSASQP